VQRYPRVDLEEFVAIQARAVRHFPGTTTRPGRLPQVVFYHARDRYCPVRVSTLTRSPCDRYSGT